MAVGEVRPGYELWHPNREKPEVITTKYVITLLMLATAGIALLVTVTGFSLLSGGSGMGVVCLVLSALYTFLGIRVLMWRRGVLPVGASLSMILAIFCAVGVNSWFARNKTGFNDGLLPTPVIGLLVIVLLLLQVVLIAMAFYGFSQDWHVEEERPIGSGEDYGAGAPPGHDAPHPA